jgi:hypothetical protein
MIETWDWILIYSILFLVGGLLARAETKSGTHPQDRAHIRADRHGDAHRPPSMPVSSALPERRTWSAVARKVPEPKPDYCLGMPARSITAAHLPMSPASRALSSSGVLALASIPRSA